MTGRETTCPNGDCQGCRDYAAPVQKVGWEMTQEVGRCGDEAPRMYAAPPTFCRLPHGHAGWHKSAGGSEWNVSETGREATLAERIDAALDYLDGQRLVLLAEADALGITLHTLRTPDGGWPGLELLTVEASLLAACASLSSVARETTP